MKQLLFCLAIAFSFTGKGNPRKINHSLWLIGKNSIVFLSANANPKVLELLKPESSIVDPLTCNLWIQSNGELMKFDRNLKLLTKIASPERILGNNPLEKSFFTVHQEKWKKRDLEGNVILEFTAPLLFPTDIEGNSEIGFWTLDVHEPEKTLSLVHFSSSGEIKWKYPISQKKELWGTPQLRWSPKTSQLWVGFSATSENHAYSPRIELWSESGTRLGFLQFPDRGLLLDSCLLEDGTFLISRDLPSSPYTAPLFTHIEKVDSNLSFELIHKAPLNDLIPSIQCRGNQIWLAHRSLFESTPSWIGLYTPKEGEKNLLALKDPAWKIHTCSLE